MKTPVLVLGFERSGTTLLRRLISMHPNLNGVITHEKNVLSTTPGGLSAARDAMGVGEKVVYCSRPDAITKYIKTFRQLFPSGGVLHIVRSGHQCARSAVETFGKDYVRVLHQHVKCLPKVSTAVQVHGGIEIAYENLILFPMVEVMFLYKWLDPDWEEDRALVEKIITTRDPWVAPNGKRMCGLKYKDHIG